LFINAKPSLIDWSMIIIVSIKVSMNLLFFNYHFQFLHLQLFLISSYITFNSFIQLSKGTKKTNQNEKLVHFLPLDLFHVGLVCEDDDNVPTMLIRRRKKKEKEKEIQLIMNKESIQLETPPSSLTHSLTLILIYIRRRLKLEKKKKKKKKKRKRMSHTKKKKEMKDEIEMKWNRIEEITERWMDGWMKWSEWNINELNVVN